MALGLWTFVLLTTFCINEASNEAFDDVAISGLRVASRAEIMARMTEETALDMFSRMKSTKKTVDLTQAIQQRFGLAPSRRPRLAQMQSTLRGAMQTTPTATGYSALQGATNMLNEMIHETGFNLETETSRCRDEEEEAHGTMATLRGQVASFNSQAADARGRVVSAQGEIATLETNIDRDQTTLENLRASCAKDISQMKYELKIITADVDVMNNILELIGECPAETSTLLQCAGCDVMLQHAPIQRMLGVLQSPAAREAVKHTLSQAWQEKNTLSEAEPKEPEEPEEGEQLEEGEEPEEPEEGEEPVVLTQEEAEHLLSTLGQRTANVTLNVSEVPESPEPQGCVMTNKCVLGPANCPKLRDRFVAVQSGIVDQKNDLEETLRQKENHCEEQTKQLDELIEGMEEKLRVERVNLATGTEDQNTAEAGSHTNAQQHEAAVSEHIKASKTCCDNRNAMLSELCALDRIRGELNNVNGTQVFISDCEVSEWQMGECSVTCGGGTRKDTRSVIAHTTGNGVGCPLLQAASSCNTHKCPVDCTVDSWSEWSECSAECGGGVKERSRQEVRKAAFDGEVCPSLEEEISCGAGACNKDCELAKWSDWSESSCSKSCGAGSLRSTRPVDVEARGTGKCPAADQMVGPGKFRRLKFKRCNRVSCAVYLRNINANQSPLGKRKVLKCDSQIDLTIVMEGSASMGNQGWMQSRRLVASIIRNLTPNVTVSLLLFSGPVNWKKGVEKCLSNTPGLSMETDCKVKWVSHYTSNFEALATEVDTLAWPKGGTLTSAALGMVDADLMYGRAGAESKVIVITTKNPLSIANTKAAAERLQQKASITWVALTGRPWKLINKMALKPLYDHRMLIPSWVSLRNRLNFWVNKVITTTCPLVV